MALVCVQMFRGSKSHLAANDLAHTQPQEVQLGLAENKREDRMLMRGSIWFPSGSLSSTEMSRPSKEGLWEDYYHQDAGEIPHNTKMRQREKEIWVDINFRRAPWGQASPLMKRSHQKNEKALGRNITSRLLQVL